VTGVIKLTKVNFRRGYHQEEGGEIKMETDTRRLIVILLLGLTIILLSLASAVTSAGETSLLPLVFTPTANAYLPIVVKQSTPIATPIPPDDVENEQSIANQLNQQRNSNGLPSLSLVSELTQAARRHSRNMADHNFTSHTGSDGSNGGQRMEEAGYDWSAWGEIIGWGFGGDTSKMVNWWMNSPPHKSTILSSSFEDFGVGYAINPTSDWGHYWTVNFGKRATYGSASGEELYVCTFITQGQSGGSSLIIYSLETCSSWSVLE
jgi:uncharacterized protein YkwD